MKHSHDTFMARALRLAEKGRGRVSPNPMVGACLVKNGKIIAQGFHQEFGGAHAESEVLQRAGSRAKGAVLYVTLEPCSTWGKTAPCAQAIIRSGIKEVVIASLDPNPKHRGKGIQILKKSGIKVRVGVMREDAEHQNRAFKKWITKKRPYVILKLAESLDGKIATRTGDSKWISSEPARKFAHRLRAESDAVLVGKNTVLRDNPKLNVRHVKARKQPWRIVLDAKAEISKSAKVFNRQSATVLVCADPYFKRAVRKFSKQFVSIVPVALDQNKRLRLDSALEKLGKLGVTSVLAEGGGEVAASFIEKKLADEIYFVIAPKIIGGRGSKTSVEGEGISTMASAVLIRNKKVIQIGDDIVISGELS